MAVTREHTRPSLHVKELLLSGGGSSAKEFFDCEAITKIVPKDMKITSVGIATLRDHANKMAKKMLDATENTPTTRCLKKSCI